MDALSRLKLMMGPVRPFLFGKIVDAWRCSVRTWTLDSRIPAPASQSFTLHDNVTQLPSKQWLEAHASEVRRFAEQAAMGKVNAYGIGTWNIGDPFLEIKDVRGVLEVSRMHAWCAYALMSHLDAAERDRWTKQFVTEFMSFTQYYPAPNGLMWNVAMDVGIRAHNMLVAWDWFRQAGVVDHSIDALIARSASDHAFVIDARLERAGGMSTSHYLGDLLGLVSVGAYVSGNDDVTDLASFAVDELRNEIAVQILDDGMDFEASTGYHRHVVDILVRCTSMMLEQHFDHDALDDVWWDKLGKAVRAQRVLEVYGMPLIGDNDDGMAMKLTGYQPDTSFMFDCAERFVPLQNIVHIAEKVAVYPMASFGLWFYSHNNFVLSVRSGGIGQYGKGGHAHNDMNSITYSLNNEQFIIDPGSAWYSGDRRRRNLDRSIQHHATVMINDKQQATFHEGGGEDLWWLFDEPEISVDARLTVWHGVVGSGRMKHTRTIAVSDEIRIEDAIDAQSRGVVNLPLAPNIKVLIHESSAELIGSRSRVLITWNNAFPHLESIEVAQGFGNSVQSTKLVLKMTSSKLQWTIAPIFAPHEA